MGLKKMLAGVAAVSLLSGIGVLATPAAASAAPQNGHGYEVPAQPYKNNPDMTDWMGSYVVNGKQVWCVRFAYKAPDSNEAYKPGDQLLTKWGTPLPANQAADMSYLLLRYGNTASNDEAAALAHLLHSWTAGVPAGDPRLNPSNDFRHIGYNIDSHFSALPASAKAAVTRIEADAEANRGPWTVELTAPTGTQTIGTPGNWTLQVKNAAGKGVSNAPVTLSFTDGKAATTTVTTPADGSPLSIPVTPTGANPSVTVSLASPADHPLVQAPANADTQQVVATGGEKQLTATAKTTAQTSPGSVKVTKVDSKTNAGIANVSLRVTGSDKTTPAIKQDGTNLTGQDGKPLVVTTGADGTVTVPDLRTPQDICITEVSAPKGYEDGFNAQSPPSVCGSVQAGQVLELKLANTPNTPTTPTVPVHIPAGDNPDNGAFTANAAVVSELQPGALLGFGALVLLGMGAIALLLRRRAVNGS